MMIRSVTSAAGAIALTAYLLAVPATAEAQDGFEFGLRGGVLMPAGDDFGGLYGGGWGGGIEGIWWVKGPVGIKLDADYFKLPIDEDVETEDDAPPGPLPDAKLFNAQLGAALSLTDRESAGVLFALHGGAGFTYYDTGGIGGEESQDVDESFFGVSGGGRLGFRTGGAVVGVDARLYYIFGDEDTVRPLTQYAVGIEEFGSFVAYPITLFISFGAG